jgi:hypothetical protein
MTVSTCLALSAVVVLLIIAHRHAVQIRAYRQFRKDSAMPEIYAVDYRIPKRQVIVCWRDGANSGKIKLQCRSLEKMVEEFELWSAIRRNESAKVYS